MMDQIKIAKVEIWGKPVGVVSWDRTKRFARFQYDPQFLKLGVELAPICMPLSDEIYRSIICKHYVA